MFSRILVACDGSLQSEKALLTAIDDCMGENTELHVVHIMNINAFKAIEAETSYDGVDSPHEISRRFLEKNRDETVKMIDRICSEKGAVFTLHVEGGDPRHAILDLALKIDSDLIVIGSTGKGLGSRLILGSVSRYVSDHSLVSTLVIK